MFELKPKHNFPTLRLLYFPLRARAEPLRMLLRHAKVPYVSEQITFEEWPTLKPQMPNKQLPQLQLGSGGRLLPHCIDIAQHIAKISGTPLLPEDDAEVALDCWREIHGTALPYVEDPWGDATPWDARIGAVNPLLNFIPAEQAISLVPKYIMGTRPWLDTLDARIKAGSSSAGRAFMNGAKPHHGEFASFAICDNLITLAGREILSAPGPSILNWYDSMRALPSIAGYVESRPQAGTGTVGRPGSLIYEHADPAAVLARAGGL